jgi:hypothetical protein
MAQSTRKAGGQDTPFLFEVQPDKSLLIPAIQCRLRLFTFKLGFNPISRDSFSLNPDDWSDDIRISGLPFIYHLWNQVFQIANPDAEGIPPLASPDPSATEDALALTLVVDMNITVPAKATRPASPGTDATLLLTVKPFKATEPPASLTPPPRF